LDGSDVPVAEEVLHLPDVNAGVEEQGRENSTSPKLDFAYLSY
jgi:hypothetical protein